MSCLCNAGLIPSKCQKLTPGSFSNLVSLVHLACVKCWCLRWPAFSAGSAHSTTTEDLYQVYLLLCEIFLNLTNRTDHNYPLCCKSVLLALSTS